ncbi:MAG: thymidine phosphorylase [Balneolaceae bacterium]|nr:thymidine phosphorylase [Balneolaceae bacterium]
MNPYQFIRKKRDGGSHSKQQIMDWVQAYTSGDLPDYQMSAFLMAGVLQGFTTNETQGFMEAMLFSGEKMDLSAIKGPKIDKHSTGGVGDKTSLLLAPILASKGVVVPMISGRGLGHTGGTLDKLASIRGFRTDLTLEQARHQCQQIGVAMMGQTEDIAPADKKIYALRDATATVESIPLIASSIMSKKCAEGIEGLVLDVKVGTGAFMETEQQARELGSTMIQLGESFGVKTQVVFTDMNQPLGRLVGNGLEVEESILGLLGHGPEDLMEVTHRLAASMFQLAGKVESIDEGVSLSKETISNGWAWAKFLTFVEAQQGDADQLKDWVQTWQNDPSVHLYTPTQSYPVLAPHAGVLTHCDCKELGFIATELGAGRATMVDKIDPAAGMECLKKLGESVEEGEPIALLHGHKGAPMEVLGQRYIASWTLQKRSKEATGQRFSTPPFIHGSMNKEMLA